MHGLNRRIATPQYSSSRLRLARFGQKEPQLPQRTLRPQSTLQMQRILCRLPVAALPITSFIINRRKAREYAPSRQS